MGFTSEVSQKHRRSGSGRGEVCVGLISTANQVFKL